MNATYDSARKTKFTTSHRRENGNFSFSQISVIDPNAEQCRAERITARFYFTGSRVYCCLHCRLWVSYPGFSTSGSAYAGGYGYHKANAALSGAISNAGFDLSECISGRGESAMRDALLAIAAWIGIKRPIIVEAHP